MKSKEQLRSTLDVVAALTGLDPTANSTWADLARRREPTQWDWPGWLPRGFLTILAGEPGLGKSTLCLHLAAGYIDGRSWPDGSPFSTSRGKILWVESEGGHNVNLERLQRWGLDPAQIITPIRNPERNFRLAGKEDNADLLLSITRDDVRLVILDSLGGLSAGNTSPRALRELLGTLVSLANNSGKAVLLTHHLRKRTSFDHDNGRPNLDRLLGSSVVSQIPRLIWALDLPDPANPETRRLSVIKNNLAPFPDPLGVRMDDYGLTFGRPPEPLNSQLEEAIQFLTGHLAAGPLPAIQVLAAAEAAGLARPTLRRAKSQLRIKSQKQPDQWVWRLQ
jgi:putative DNA primase/helicase